MTVQFRSRIPSVIDYAAEIKSVGVCCYLGDDGNMTSVESTQIECYTLKGHFQFGDINEISCDEVADTGCCCSCSEASKHENVEDYEAFLDAAANSADANCTSGPARPAWGDGIGLKSNTTQCQCDKLGGKWTAGDCPTIFNDDVTHKDGVRTRCYVPGTIVPLEYKYYCTGTGSCASCLSANCPDDGTVYYTDKAECDLYCVDPIRWNCCEGKCYSANDATLPYATEAQCLAACPRLICGIENNQRKCITTFNDPKGTNGSFGNLLDCLASCEQDVKGTCCLSSIFNYHHSCRTVTTPDECVNRTGPGHWTLFQYHNLTTNEASATYTATYTAGKTMCGPISPFTDPNCSVRTPLGYLNQGHCFGYNNTDPTIFDNAKFTMEWDCYENGGADWVGLLSEPQARAAALTLKPNWFCIDGTCTQRYTMPGATYPYPTGISYANEAACLLVGCTPESPTPPQCNIATGRCCGTGDGSGSGSGSGSAVIDPTGPVNPITVGGQEYPHRVTRGGPACGYGSFYVRSSFRDESAHYQTRSDGIGFRVVRTPEGLSDLWYTELEAIPDPVVVTDANLRAAITETGLPWRIRATPSNIEMVLIPKGTFMMGCSPSTATWWPGCETTGELPKHQVTLTKSFYISRTPVTQAQWTAKMGSNPSFFNNVQQNGFTINTDRPVESVSWEDVAGVSGFMSQTNFRLPTEAEWEYAYRAGTTTAFHGYPGQPNGFNDDINGTELQKIAWFGGNIGNCGQFGTSAYGTKAVGLKLANGFGLYDMSGNVFEWCQDWYGPYAGGGGCNQNGCTVTNQAGCLPPCIWTEVSDGSEPCAPNACAPPEPTACCYVDANGDRKCKLGITESACNLLGGFLETGVNSCSSCDPFVGKCCKTSGDCIDNITKVNCLLEFGTWTQFGTCTPNTCPVPLPDGICCTNGVCTITKETECSSGDWTETTLDCSSACSCCPCTTGPGSVQRCCTTNTDGSVSCTNKTVIECMSGGGGPGGIGTNCLTQGGGGTINGTNPTGPMIGDLKVLRGGHYLDQALAASTRKFDFPDTIRPTNGFRAARNATVFDGSYTILEQLPNAAVVTDSTIRNAIVQSGYPWRIRDNSSNIEMLLVPAGTFTMGCTPACGSSAVAHQVTLTNAFYLGKTEVTQAQWIRTMGNNPSAFQGNFIGNIYPDSSTRPVEQVSWNMIASGSTSFMSLTGLRLPTEAEWEYACRAGTVTPLYGTLSNIAWHWGNSSGTVLNSWQTHLVASKVPNIFGLYDTIGNVWEWCQDWYEEYPTESGAPACDVLINCCSPNSCSTTTKTPIQCKDSGGVPSSGLPCCVTCCYNENTSNPTCGLVYSTALCDAGKRCTSELSGRVITSPDTCDTCVALKWECATNGSCSQTLAGTYTSEQECLSNCVLGGCCGFGALCRNSFKADCVFPDSWGALCDVPPQICDEDVIIIVDPCEGLPPSTTTVFCFGNKKTLECPECCVKEPIGFETCLDQCAIDAGCGPAKAASQQFFPGRANIVPEAACQIDVRIPRACCYIEYDPTFGPVGMTCDNVCSSAECEKLKTVSNSKHPAVYSGGAICPSRRLASSGPTLDCDSNIHLSLTNRSFYAGIPFGTCWTLGLTAQYSCDVSDESACGVVNGYWVSLETSEGQMCDSTYRPQPINISTQRIIEPETMNDSEFQSLGLEFGDFYKGGYYIGTYSPGAPITQFGSSLYGSLNLTTPITSPSTAYGNGENVVAKWALIVEPYTYRTSFLNETEPRILLPHSKLSKYDGFYNCYGNAGFGGLRSSLTNSVLGRNRRGFPDYYLPSIQELMFFAFQINDFSTDNYIKYISIFKNDLLKSMPSYLSSTSIGDTSLYSQYLQPVDRYTFGNIATSTLTSVNTVKFFRRINLT